MANNLVYDPVFRFGKGIRGFWGIQWKTFDVNEVLDEFEKDIIKDIIFKKVKKENLSAALVVSFCEEVSPPREHKNVISSKNTKKY